MFRYLRPQYWLLRFFLFPYDFQCLLNHSCHFLDVPTVQEAVHELGVRDFAQNVPLSDHASFFTVSQMSTNVFKPESLHKIEAVCMYIHVYIYIYIIMYNI